MKILDIMVRCATLGDRITLRRPRHPELLKRGEDSHAWMVAEATVDGQSVDFVIAVPLSAVREGLVMGSNVRLRLYAERVADMVPQLPFNLEGSK